MWIAISALNLALAVMLGAFGAHGLKARATEAQLGWWQTATDYFFYHALGLLILSLLAKVIPALPIQWSFGPDSGRHFTVFWLTVYHGLGITPRFRCYYAHWRGFNDCRMVNSGLECFKIRQISLNNT